MLIKSYCANSFGLQTGTSTPHGTKLKSKKATIFTCLAQQGSRLPVTSEIINYLEHQNIPLLLMYFHGRGYQKQILSVIVIGVSISLIEATDQTK